jgi:hypothetical protein
VCTCAAAPAAWQQAVLQQVPPPHGELQLLRAQLPAEAGLAGSELQHTSSIAVALAADCSRRQKVDVCLIDGQAGCDVLRRVMLGE